MSKELVTITNLVKAPRQFHVKGKVLYCGPLEASEEITRDSLTPMIKKLEKQGLVKIDVVGGV